MCGGRRTGWTGRSRRCCGEGDGVELGFLRNEEVPAEARAELRREIAQVLRRARRVALAAEGSSG